MRTSVLILILLLLCGLFAGCYTMLVHPRTEGTDDWHTTRRHCSDCHNSADYYYWHFPSYNNWYYGQRSWRSYYYDPWWWNDYWYWYDDNGEPVNREAPRYFEDRERPVPPPGLAPSEPQIEQQSDKPATPGGSTIGNQPSQPAKQGQPDSQYYKTRERPTKKETEPDKPKAKEEKKAEDEN